MKTTNIALRYLQEREDTKSILRRQISDLIHSRDKYPTNIYQDLLNSYFDQLRRF